ncbi:TetR/AcrR family transcriptional regulator [Endozoicomonas numazuensis]|uniref:Transcriptional regulator n=1 Tax=Endozoicomonas numazuensis TaxID=1137799 RepID=A0A081NE65_9GAMM|nr:TetR/AcrR family transcriptional regulator [Endozoicomonas numazuensis]KEQ16738.1 transcriptional regulator [Endozoicomonas numazuensis]
MMVKEKKRGRPTQVQSNLTGEKIVQCARRLMLEEEKVPSIRRVSGELGVDAMAIYYYFNNKAALLEAVTVSLIEGIYEPTGTNDWQKELTLLCHSYLELLKNHAGLLETMLSMSSPGPAQVFTERFYTALSPLHLDKKTEKDALDLLADYLHGFALAMHCNNSSSSLSSDQLEGPLQFCIRALSREATLPISQ